MKKKLFISYKDILNDSIIFIKEEYKLLLMIFIIFFFLFDILGIVFIPELTPLKYERLSWNLSQWVKAITAAIAIAFIYLIGMMITIFLISYYKKKKKFDMGKVIINCKKRIFALIVTNILAAIILLLWSLLLLIPGIIFMVYYAFVEQIVILEDKSGMNALNRSKELVKGRWWTLAILLLLFWIISFIASNYLRYVTLYHRLGIGSLILIDIFGNLLTFIFYIVLTFAYFRFLQTYSKNEKRKNMSGK